MSMRRPVLIVAIAIAVACAPAATSGERRDRNIITTEEIVASQRTNAYDVISQLRPAFLRSRGRSTLIDGVSDHAAIYLDGQRYGTIESLKSISIDNIREIRYLDAASATTRFGSGHTHGVIELLTR